MAENAIGNKSTEFIRKNVGIGNLLGLKNAWIMDHEWIKGTVLVIHDSRPLLIPNINTARVYENDTVLVKMPLIFVPFHPFMPF